MAGSCTLLALQAHQSFSRAQERASLVAALAVSQIDNSQPSESVLPLVDIPPAFESAQLAVLSHDDIVIEASPSVVMPLGAVQASADLGNRGREIVVAIPTHTVIADTLPTALVGILVIAALYGWSRPFITAGRRSRTDLDALPYGLAFWSDDGRLIRANCAFSRLLHLDKEDLTAGCTYTAITKTLQGEIVPRPVLDTDRQRLVEVILNTGRTVLMDERPCPSGGFFSVITDITERKTADQLLARVREEQKLLARRYHDEKVRAEASSRAKSSFLAHISHDIRTPLNHIIGFADMIRLETFGPLGDPKYRTYLDDIKRSGEQLLGSFAEILDYAELEAGRKTLKRERLSINTLLNDTATRYAARAKNAGVTLRVEDNPDGEVIGDRHYLDRMLANLVDNALRYSEAGGLIRMASWIAEGGVVLEVTDTGAGMSEEQMARLSQPFVLSDAAFARDHHGAGLGIATARAIAEQSGGRLAIDSLEGIGTTVAIPLPLAETHDRFAPRPDTVSQAAA